MFCFVFFDKISQMQKNERNFYGMDCFVFILWCIMILQPFARAHTHSLTSFLPFSIVFGIWCEFQCICVLRKIFCFREVSIVFIFIQLFSIFFSENCFFFACCMLRTAFFLYADYRFLRFLFPMWLSMCFA